MTIFFVDCHVKGGKTIGKLGENPNFFGIIFLTGFQTSELGVFDFFRCTDTIKGRETKV